MTPWVSNDTFSFDIYNSYTFNHYNAYEDDDYEFDCYKLSSKVISEISKNHPPQYFIYNQKKYEVDNVNLDYFEVDFVHEDLVEDFGITNEIQKKYNAIIFWNDYDEKYQHFDSVMILNGTESFILYKYIDFSNYEYWYEKKSSLQKSTGLDYNSSKTNGSIYIGLYKSCSLASTSFWENKYCR